MIDKWRALGRLRTRAAGGNHADEDCNIINQAFRALEQRVEQLETEGCGQCEAWDEALTATLVGRGLSMSKLDEIEATVQTFYTTTSGVKVQMMHRDAALLFRAVRQLGRETMSWYSSRPDLAVERIDPDVLTLIAFDKGS